MLQLTCPNCGAECAETELAAGGEAHLKHFGRGSGVAMAETLARGEPDELAGPFSLARFSEGRMIDESVAAAVAH
jgi:hypothetical protein